MFQGEKRSTYLLTNSGKKFQHKRFSFFHYYFFSKIIIFQEISLKKIINYVDDIITHHESFVPGFDLLFAEVCVVY